MILGIIVFSLLFITFVVFGTLLICGKGYLFISGYRALTNEEKAEFVSTNNLKAIFRLYAYYCYAVSAVTLLALIGACCDSVVVILVSYLLFGAGTIATIIVANANSTYKVTPIKKETGKDNAVVAKIEVEGKGTADTTTDEAVDVKENKEVEADQPVAEVKEVKEATPVATKKPATKTGSKSTTKSTTSKSTTSKSTTTKSTTTKSATKSTTARKTTGTKSTSKPKTTSK